MNNLPPSLPTTIPGSIPLPIDGTTRAADSLPTSETELQKIGEDFESIFLSLMLKEMRNSISSEEGGGFFSGEGSDTYGGMFDMFISQHLAESSPLGISEAIESYLSNQNS